MNFVSLEFWLVLVVALLVYFLLRKFLFEKEEWDRRFVLVLSCLLFVSESFISFTIFVALGWWVFLLLHSPNWVPERYQNFLKWFGVIVALTPLLFFKYWYTENLIPIGLSFYTFQLLSLVFDASRSSLKVPSLREYWSFASFFPQIVAGPIERRESLLPQLQAFRFRWSAGDLQKGLQFIILGFFYKLVVADNLASSGHWITSETNNPWIIHAANFLFGFRIYFDFCGYSLIAFGLAAAMGIRLTMNFRAPYWQTNPQNFWRCWHVSLSRWFRDYIYVPLGGKDAPYPALAILLVFGVSGVWHGAGWNFLVWGLAHGLLLIGYRLLGNRFPMPAILAWGITLIAMMTCWLCFYQTESEVLSSKLQTLVEVKSYLANPYREFLRLSGGQGGLVYVVAAGIIASLVLALEGLAKSKASDPYRWSSHWGIQMFLVITTVFFAPVENNGFVYFNF